jgi:hypothetical protein
VTDRSDVAAVRRLEIGPPYQPIDLRLVDLYTHTYTPKSAPPPIVARL